MLLIVLGVCARLPAIQGELLWDDHPLVEANPMIRSPLLILEAFRHYLFPGASSGHYRPVQTLSYILDYYFWNLEPVGFHLSNLGWHIGSGVLLYFLLRRLLPMLIASATGSATDINEQAKLRASAIASVLIALLWIVHPVHSAAIDYVSGRADSLAFVFAAGAWLLYLRARETPLTWVRAGLFFLAALTGLLALSSRESGLIWMLLFVLYVFVVEQKLTLRQRFVVLSVCLAVAAIYLGLRQLPEARATGITSPDWSMQTRAVLMLRALGDYGRLMVLPTGLHVERTVIGFAAIDYLAIGGGILLCVFAYGASRKGAGHHLRMAGAGWFLLTYLPISNVVPLNATVAEHWLYLPSVGFLLFLTGAVIDLPQRYQKAAVGVASIAILALTIRSAIRSSDWVDPETFFRRTFAAGATNSRIGVNLGVIYAQHGKHAEAEKILRKVLQVSPDFPVARNNLGIALSQQGKTAEAESYFQSATVPDSAATNARERTWDGALHLAQSRSAQQDTSGALAILEQAKRDFPGTWELVRCQAEIVRTGDGPDAALPLVQQFATDNWWHAAASLALGRMYLERADLSGAAAAFQNASRLDVHDAESVSLMSLIKLKQNRLEEAYQLQLRAVARQPDEPRQQLILSDVLMQMGRKDEAQARLAEVAHMQALAKSHSGRE